MAKNSANMIKMQGNFVGGWAFLIGVILAFVLGFLGGANQNWTYVLFVIGLIVGFLNIADRESESFLMAGVVLVIVSAFGQGVLGVIPALSRIFDFLMTIFIPATVVVAIRHAFGLARR